MFKFSSNILVATMLLAVSIKSIMANSYPKSLSPITDADQATLIGYNAADNYVLGDIWLGSIDALQSEPNNNQSACWTAGNIARLEIYKLSKTFNPSLILNNFQLFQIKVQNTVEACALKILINYLDSRMSNLDYTLGIISNIISESSSGITTEYKFLDTYGTATLTNDLVANSGPNISVYQSLNYLYVVWRDQTQPTGDWYLIGFYFSKLLAGFLNFKSPNVSADLGSD